MAPGVFTVILNKPFASVRVDVFSPLIVTVALVSGVPVLSDTTPVISLDWENTEMDSMQHVSMHSSSLNFI